MTTTSEEALQVTQETKTSIASTLDETANRLPGKLAIVSPCSSVTYYDVRRRSVQMAAAIGPQEVDTVTALMFRDLTSLIPAAFGVFRAGGVALIIDPDYPIERITYILDHAGPIRLAYDDQVARIAEDVSDRVDSLLLWRDVLQHDPVFENLALDPGRNMLLSYTSGSTGNPKGIVSPQGKLLDLNVRWTIFQESERVLFTASPSFAGSHSTMFGAILAGASIHAYPMTESATLIGLANWINDQKITVLKATPSLFRHLMASTESGFEFPTVRKVTAGGDLVTPADVAIFKKRFHPECTYRVGYATSEVGGVASINISMSTPIEGSLVPAGTLNPRIEVRLLDDNGLEVPTGETGEIVVTSHRRGSSFWKDEKATAERFVPVPGREGYISVHTGDLGRFDDDGLLYFVGRKDRMLKVRGFRVEPAEIETALASHPGVIEAAVIGRRNDQGDTSLVGFITAVEQIDPKELRSFLYKRLPDYMMPSRIVRLDRIPLTPNGKVDHIALQSYEPPAPALPRRGGRWTGDSLEAQLLIIWREALDATVGVNDDFFESGGTSIIAARIMGEVEKLVGEAYPLASLIKAPTVREQAELLKGMGWKESFDLLVPMRTEGSRPPLFCIAGGLGNILDFYPLVWALGPDQPVYALQSPGLDGNDVGGATFSDVAAKYIEKMKSVQPEGPYFVVGFSLGGKYAFEIAQQLRRNGESMGLVALGDTALASRDSLMERAKRRFEALRSNPAKYARRIPRQWAGRMLLQVKGSIVIAFKRLGLQPPRRLRTAAVANTIAQRGYELTRYDGELLVLRGESLPGIPNPGVEGWTKYARTVRFVDFAADHGNMLTERGGLRVVAEALRDEIDRGLELESSPAGAGFEAQ